MIGVIIALVLVVGILALSMQELKAGRRSLRPLTVGAVLGFSAICLPVWDPFLQIRRRPPSVGRTANGLLIRESWVRIPHGPPSRARRTESSTMPAGAKAHHFRTYKPCSR